MSCIPATPVAADAVVIFVLAAGADGMSPDGIAGPWHSRHVVTPVGTDAWNARDVLHEGGDAAASAAWHETQSRAVTYDARWLTCCPLALRVVTAGSDTVWQSTHAVGAEVVWPWKLPPVQPVHAGVAALARESAAVWHVEQLWNVSCGERCTIA